MVKKFSYRLMFNNLLYDANIIQKELYLLW